MANSIGSLYIDITARTATMEEGLAEVKSQVLGLTNAVNGQGPAWSAVSNQIEGKVARFGVLMLGARSAVTLLANEFKDVSQNIENIDGLSPGVVQSVEQLRYGLVGVQSPLKQAIAQLEAWFYEFNAGMGYFAGEVAYGNDALKGVTEKQLTPDDTSRLSNPNFDQQVQAAQEQYNALKQQEILQNETLAQQYDTLTALVKSYYKQTTAYGADSLDKIELQTKGLQDQMAADQKLAQIEAASDAAQAKYTTAINQITTKQNGTPLDAQIQQYKDSLNSIQDQINALPSSGLKSADQLQAQTKLLNQYADQWKQVKPLIDKSQEGVVELRNTFVSSFSQISDTLATFITTGKADFASFFQQVLQQMISMEIKLAAINPLMNEVFGGSSGWQSLPTLWGGSSAAGINTESSFIGTGFGDIAGEAGLASGGPISSPRLVGELGPEVFIPPSGGGTIIPNNQLQAQSSSGPNVTVVYNIPSGVTRNELAPILEQNNRRLKGDIANTIKRGGAAASQFVRA